MSRFRVPTVWRPLALGLAAAGACGLARANQDGLAIRPGEVRLEGNFARAQLVVGRAAPGSPSAKAAAGEDVGDDLTRQAVYTSADPSVAVVDSAGRLLAVGNGSTRIAVACGERSGSVPVEVVGVAAEPAVDFAADVLPILGKAGCNSGACHASQYGKGGFVLSVFGFDPQADLAAVVRDRQGRRVNLLEPAESLILKKPSLRLPHGGGRRLASGSTDHEMLLAWIAAGAVPPAAPVKVAALDVFPPRRTATVGADQQLRVEAVYADGRRRDVTHWARFDSLDDAVLKVSPDGLMTAVGRGPAAVLVRFEGQAALAEVVTPYQREVALDDWQDRNFIDALARAKLVELGIPPAPLCDDPTFLRRAYLDAIGTLPTVDQTQRFLESGAPDKRDRLIDALLGLSGDPALDVHNDAYAAYWTLKWSDLIRVSSDNLGEQGLWALHNWIRESLRVDKPLDQFARELITARGSAYMNGPANYFRIGADAAEQAEATAQIFLGIRLQCAKCHHHPFEKYSQEDYYSFAAFFARVGRKSSQEFGLFGGEQAIVVRTAGEVTHPRTGQAMPPAPLEGAAVDDPHDRRQPLARWLTSPENRWFARNAVNRYVAYLLGAGLVEPVDDLRATNPASNPALLEALADAFGAQGYSLKKLLRTIMQSRIYQLDWRPLEANQADERFYSHFRVKRLAAEPLLDAVDQVTGVKTKFTNLPAAMRAIELPDSNYQDHFLITFGKPRRVSVCECERVADANLAQALHTLNGDLLAAKIANPAGRVARLVAAGKAHDEIVAELYLAALCRQPSPDEQAACRELAAESPSPQSFYEDLMWTLLNSKEFLFVH